MDIWLDIAPGSGILVNKSVEFHVVPKRVKKYQLSILYSSVLNNRPLLIIIQDEIKSKVWAQLSSRKRVSEVTGPINRTGGFLGIEKILIIRLVENRGLIQTDRFL